jgi:DNA repair protein SbcD/Mre11
MRLLHTADWHLGHVLAGHTRDDEHVAFLQFLADTLEEQRIDALLIAGDIFDTTNPSVLAQTRYFRFIADVRKRMPQLHVVVIGGNHDSATRIDAPRDVFAHIDVHVVGALPADITATLSPVHVGGDLAAVVVALPFLRAHDLQTSDAHTVGDAVSDVYRRAKDAARSRFPGVPLVLMGHLHAAGGRFSPQSERAVFGNAHAVPLLSFIDDGETHRDVAYTALGHLHLAQSLHKDGRIRYSGSPIPLSMAERDYSHECTVVDTAGNAAPTSIPIPRTAKFIRIGSIDASLDDVLAQLQLLHMQLDPHKPPPFLDVIVKLDGPVPDVRTRITDAIGAAKVRLTRVQRHTNTVDASLADMTNRLQIVDSTLKELSPMSVFSSMYARKYDTDPPQELTDAFRELMRAVR